MVHTWGDHIELPRQYMVNDMIARELVEDRSEVPTLSSKHVVDLDCIEANLLIVKLMLQCIPRIKRKPLTLKESS